MRSPAYLVQPNIQRLPNLLRDIQEGEIRIPRFQRPFVWSDTQRIELFESIYEGIPVGSILIWRTREHDLRCYEKLGPFQLSWSGRSEENGQGVQQYVLDGHQRLTTLFVALSQGLIQREGEEAGAGQEDASPIDSVWPIYFDLEKRAFEVHRRRGTPPDTWLPLSILFDPFKLFEFQKRLLDRGADRALTNRAEALASTFKDYSVPVVPIVTEDLELATASFQRVNRGGTPMNEVHMISALTWTPEFDLSDQIGDAREELGEIGWQNLEDQMILNTCKALLDLDIYDAEAESIQEAIKQRPRVLQEAIAALMRAARFLRDHCGVYGPTVLPYSFQAVLLADSLRLVPASNHSLEIALTHWFWLTTYTEHFAGISAGSLARTQADLRKVAIRGETPTPSDLSEPVMSPRRFVFRTARSRAMAILMADLQVLHGAEDPNPHQFLADFGKDAVPKLIVGGSKLEGDLTEGAWNRLLVHPREAADLRRKLVDRACRGQDPEFLARHAIDEGAINALESGDLTGFLLSRREVLLRYEAKFVESLGLTYQRI